MTVVVNDVSLSIRFGHFMCFSYIIFHTQLCFCLSSLLDILQDDMDKHIAKLNNELESANRKCEIYRANLLSVLKAFEDHKLELSVKVENIKISMKDGL